MLCGRRGRRGSLQRTMCSLRDHQLGGAVWQREDRQRPGPRQWDHPDSALGVKVALGQRAQRWLPALAVLARDLDDAVAHHGSPDVHARQARAGVLADLDVDAAFLELADQ